MTPRPIRAVPNNDKDTGSGMGASDAVDRKPIPEPAPSLTSKIEVREYGTASDVMVAN